ncbi:MAG: BatA domain-containing protein, partial [Pirellulales bacterium]
MAFLNASMMIGGLLIAVPFLIHLAMRRKPTVELFPALRFVRKKQVTNKRTLRFKQWLLLLLRSLLLAILVFALAGPSADRLVAGNWVIIGTVSLLILLVAVVLIAAVAEQVSRSMVVLITIVLLLLTGFDGLFVYSTLTNDESVLVGDEDAAVAAVLIFDNSPRMGYQQNDQTRLAAGQFIGDWLVRQLPNDSQIAVIDLAAPPHVFSQDINSAVHAIEQLQITYTPELLQTAIRSALELISTSELTRHEVYLFTDLAKSAWETIPESLSVALRAADVELFLVDVG